MTQQLIQRAAGGCWLITMLLGLNLCPTARAACADQPERTPHLLFMLTDPDAPAAQALSECDRLTIEEYRKRGARVTERTNADLEKWLQEEGVLLAKAGRDFQYVAFAKANEADAIGGLAYWDMPKSIADQFHATPGPRFGSWGISLAACSRSHAFPSVPDPTAIRALSLDHEYAFELPGQEFSIPFEIRPVRRFSLPSGVARTLGMAPARERRPFLGIRFDSASARISKILKAAPAEAAGLLVGDEVISVAGKPVESMVDVREALKNHAPGTSVEVEFRRGEALITKNIPLVNYYDYLDERSPVGKPIPGWEGRDEAGLRVNLADLKGSVVLLDFWATWCGPCIAKMPLHQVLWDKLKDRDFVWISVSVDEDEAAWRDFVRDNQLGGVQLRNREWADALGVTSYPTTYLIDRTGTVRCESGDAAVVMGLLSEK